MSLLTFLLTLIVFTITIYPVFAQSCPSPPPGDANNDCQVDGRDYIIWLNHYNQKTAKGITAGDFDRNGTVDGLDYIIWRNNYNQSSISPTKTTISPTISQPGQLTSCQRPYKPNSPWNTPIDTDPKTHPNSDKIISSLVGIIGSDPFKVSYPVYQVNRKTKLKKVKYLDNYRYLDDDEKLIHSKKGQDLLNLPIPDDAPPSSDGVLVILNLDTGEEWNLTGAQKEKDDSWKVKDVYKYHTRYSGFAPGPFSRNFGTPLLAGLIRACEIRQGQVNHAIAFAGPVNIPRGTRLQLKPNATENEIKSWCGNNNTCRIIAKALQQYGMYQVDQSAKPKIFVEHEKTAHWGNILKSTTLSNIPISQFRVIIPKK